VMTHHVNTLREDNIFWTATSLPYDWPGSDAPDFLLSTGVSALDSVHDIYYLAMPQVANVPGIGLSMFSYTTRIYAFNINAGSGARVLLKQDFNYRIVLLEANSKFHQLFALLLQNNPDPDRANEFYYAQLGMSRRNNASFLLEFVWTFSTPEASAVNPYSSGQFKDKFYQIGATTVDHLSTYRLLCTRSSQT